MELTLNLEGLSQALKEVKEIIDPNLRASAHLREELANKEREAKVNQLQSEQKVIEAKVLRELASVGIDRGEAEKAIADAKKLEAEARLVEAQAQKIDAEANAIKNQVQLTQIECAMKIVDKYLPNADGIEKFAHIANLLPAIAQLSTNSFTLAPSLPNNPQNLGAT